MTANNKIVLVACTIVCILLALGVPTVNAFVDNRGKPFVVSKTTRIDNNPLLLNVRGGDATSLEVEESDAEDFEIESSDEEYDDDDEEEESEDELDPKLAKSAQSSATKVRAKATAAAKAAVNTKLEKTAPVLTKKKKSSSGGLLKLFHIPYIVKALFNPFTLMQMTKGYWASLFNLNYLDENKVTFVCCV